ncbi:DUF3168 domain-containing protein [Brucella cytisi]|uniref:DUF3168 domain-containing protein n=1 Tax=Brucella cytisi TaxID=407152 RepID=A0A1J6HG19_9HYPH|nr:DUF3168 domain-containing protein [Brucella cytisi]OIS91933.1 hypothetical protein BLA27_18630 [Brucella cytisi]
MDPIQELQSAVIPRLRSFPALVSLVGQRSYDNPPTNDQGQVAPSIFPYVSIGPSSSTADDADCVYGHDIIFQIDVWSLELPQRQMREIANAVRLALRDWEPTLSDNALVDFRYWRTDYIRDGAINHASVRFTAFIEQP